MKYRKKPVEIEAVQWNKHGDHPAVKTLPSSHPMWGHGFIDPDNFGWVATLEGGHVVTPGDYIIRGVKGELYPCKPDIFHETYEAVSPTKPVRADQNSSL